MSLAPDPWTEDVSDWLQTAFNAQGSLIGCLVCGAGHRFFLFGGRRTKWNGGTMAHSCRGPRCATARAAPPPRCARAASTRCGTRSLAPTPPPPCGHQWHARQSQMQHCGCHRRKLSDDQHTSFNPVFRKGPTGRRKSEGTFPCG